jgi:cathepsin B
MGAVADSNADFANLHEPPTQMLADEEEVSVDPAAGSEKVDGIEENTQCPGSARYGYDKIKALGGCLPKQKSTIPAWSEFKVTYHWTQVEDGILCKFSLESAKHGFTLEVLNTGEDHPQQGVPVEEDKYEMKTCANHVDEMEHYPVQGAMGLKEMNAQELAEFKGFRSELGELPAPTVEELATIPASYDLRTKWPQCKWLNNPGNQGGCGSCWAFAATLAASTRLCMASNGTYNTEISPQDMNSCTRTSGCRGGWPHCGFLYMSDSGSICGGAAGKREGLVDNKCDPYTAKDHTGGNKCGSHCKSPPAVAYQTKRSSIKWVASRNEAAMQKEIMTKGAIVNCFDVYNDFSGRGVYTKGSRATKRGAHAVATIGWGVDKGVKYWLVENSWGKYWGEKGYFRIKRGVDEARFESWPYCYGGVAADVVLPKGAKPIVCVNGGTASKDGKTCTCPYGSSGKTCERCTPCKNSGVRAGSSNCNCKCRTGFFGALCQERFKQTCAHQPSYGYASTSSGIADPVAASRLLKAGDYVVMVPRTTDCKTSSSYVTPVGVEGAYKKYACGKYVKGKKCGSWNVVFGKVNKTGTWTACIVQHLGFNEFGADKGYAADGLKIGTCSLTVTAAPVTAAPVTAAPETAAPETAAPVTAAPVTVAPVSAAPETAAPVATTAPVAAPTGTPVSRRRAESIDCTTTGEKFSSQLKAKQNITVTCAGSCAYNIDQADEGWGVFGMGPFRIDSHICRAAFTAGIIGHSGGSATMYYDGEEPEFVPFGALMKGTFCFEGMKNKCTFNLAGPRK